MGQGGFGDVADEVDEDEADEFCLRGFLHF